MIDIIVLIGLDWTGLDWIGLDWIGTYTGVDDFRVGIHTEVPAAGKTGHEDILLHYNLILLLLPLRFLSILGGDSCGLGFCSLVEDCKGGSEVHFVLS